MTAVDVTPVTVEHLDFDPPCDVPDPPTDHGPARWIIHLADCCNGKPDVVLWCDPCLQLALGDDRCRVVCCVCGHRWTPGALAIRYYEALRP